MPRRLFTPPSRSLAPAPDAPPDPSRRAFLRLGLQTSLFALTLCLPRLARAGLADEKPSFFPTHKPKAPRLLMLDPGHGGHDPGAIGHAGLYEKDVTLDIVRRLAASLDRNRALDVRATRDSDVFLPLAERVTKAREAHADFFVSIHADSAPNTHAQGLSVYTLAEKASDTFARDLATKENLADKMGGLDLGAEDKDVAAILFDLTARRTRNASQKARAAFVRGMGRHWQLLDSPMRAANFAVLRAPDIPSILVETGFLSNAADEKLLSQPRARQKIAQLMAEELAPLLESPLFS